MQLHFPKTFFFLLLLSIFFIACEDENTNNDKDNMLDDQENIKVRIPKFDGNGAKAGDAS